MSLLWFCSCWKFGSLDCGWLACVQLIVFVCLLVVAVWGKTNVISQAVWYFILFVDVLDFFGVLILVCE